MCSGGLDFLLSSFIRDDIFLSLRSVIVPLILIYLFVYFLTVAIIFVKLMTKIKRNIFKKL